MTDLGCSPILPGQEIATIAAHKHEELLKLKSTQPTIWPDGPACSKIILANQMCNFVKSQKNSPNLTEESPCIELHPDVRGREARVVGGDGAAVLRHDQLPNLRGQAPARADHRQDQLQTVPEGVLGH